MTAVTLTANWAFYIGDQEKEFDHDVVAYAFWNSRVVNEARNFWYEQAQSGRNMILNPITNFKGEDRFGGGNFGITGLFKAGLDPIEQFVGSTRDFTIMSDGRNITYKFTNVTSFESLMYGLTPNFLNFYNTKQTYILSETIDWERLSNF